MKCPTNNQGWSSKWWKLETNENYQHGNNDENIYVSDMDYLDNHKYFETHQKCFQDLEASNCNHSWGSCGSCGEKKGDGKSVEYIFLLIYVLICPEIYIDMYNISICPEILKI